MLKATILLDVYPERTSETGLYHHIEDNDVAAS